MNLSSDINPNLPCLRPLISARGQNRHMSTSSNSKSTFSSNTTSSFKTNGFHLSCSTLPVLIQLCIYPDEDYACRTIRLLFSSRYRYSSDVSDEFGCNILMYALRYQRYHLFEFLLNETSFDINLHARDRQGNTILHYAILYGGSDTQIIEKLIVKYHKFGIHVDERNTFGLTPLLLAVYCGHYEYAMVLLKQTNASPFVRDHIQSKNILDYLEIDVKQKESSKKLSENRQSTRLRIQLYQTLLPRPQSSIHTVQHHAHKNFFETILPSAINDLSGSIRSMIIQTLDDTKCSSSFLKPLVTYLNRRYPQINTARQRIPSTESTRTSRLVLQRENSKTSLHHILNLFDPDLRPKAVPPPPPPPPAPPFVPKPPITFKRLGTKLTVLAALSRPPVGKIGGSFSFVTSGSK